MTAPRPRITIRRLMIFVAVLALVNASVAWVVRHPPSVPRPIEETRRAQLIGFFVLNVVAVGIGIMILLMESIDEHIRREKGPSYSTPWRLGYGITLAVCVRIILGAARDFIKNLHQGRLNFGIVIICGLFFCLSCGFLLIMAKKAEAEKPRRNRGMPVKPRPSR